MGARPRQVVNADGDADQGQRGDEEVLSELALGLALRRGLAVGLAGLRFPSAGFRHDQDPRHPWPRSKPCSGESSISPGAPAKAVEPALTKTELSCATIPPPMGSLQARILAVPLLLLATVSLAPAAAASPVSVCPTQIFDPDFLQLCLQGTAPALTVTPFVPQLTPGIPVGEIQEWRRALPTGGSVSIGCLQLYDTTLTCEEL